MDNWIPPEARGGTATLDHGTDFVPPEARPLASSAKTKFIPPEAMPLRRAFDFIPPEAREPERFVPPEARPLDESQSDQRFIPSEAFPNAADPADVETSGVSAPAPAPVQAANNGGLNFRRGIDQPQMPADLQQPIDTSQFFIQGGRAPRPGELAGPNVQELGGQPLQPSAEDVAAMQWPKGLQDPYQPSSVLSSAGIQSGRPVPRDGMIHVEPQQSQQGYDPKSQSSVMDTPFDFARSVLGGMAEVAPAAQRMVGMIPGLPGGGQDELDAARSMEQGARGAVPPSVSAQLHPDSARTKITEGVGNLAGKIANALPAGPLAPLVMAGQGGVEGTGNTYARLRELNTKNPNAAAAITGLLDAGLMSINPFGRFVGREGSRGLADATEKWLMNWAQAQGIAAAQGAGHTAIEQGIGNQRTPSGNDVERSAMGSLTEMAPVNAIVGAAHQAVEAAGGEPRSAQRTAAIERTARQEARFIPPEAMPAASVETARGKPSSELDEGQQPPPSGAESQSSKFVPPEARNGQPIPPRKSSTAEDITASMGALGKSAQYAGQKRNADLVRDGSPPTFQNEAAKNLVRKQSARYRFNENPDGSITLTDAIDPDTGKWVSESARGSVPAKSEPSQFTPPEALESWRRTQADFVASHPDVQRAEADNARSLPIQEQRAISEHFHDVRRAIADGEQVPAEVLKDYPGLENQPARSEVAADARAAEPSRVASQETQPFETASRSIVEASMNDLKRAAEHFGIDPEQNRSKLVASLREVEVGAQREGSLAPKQSLLDQVPATKPAGETPMPEPQQEPFIPPEARAEQPEPSLALPESKTQRTDDLFYLRDKGNETHRGTSELSAAELDSRRDLADQRYDLDRRLRSAELSPQEKASLQDQRDHVVGKLDQLMRRAPSAAKPEQSAPPLSNPDQLELWAKDRLQQKRKAQSEKLANLTPEQRRQRGSAGSLDPEELVLHAVIGYAKIARGVKRFADWSAEMLRDVPGLGRQALATIWQRSRRLSQMDEQTRAEWIKSQLETPQSMGTKQAIRANTGQVDYSRFVRESDALSASLASQRRAAAQGWRAAVEQGAGIRKELARITQESLPPDAREPMLRQIARAQTLADLRTGLIRLQNLLTAHEARQSLARAEKLTGTLKLDPADSRKPELSEADEAAAMGNRMVAKLKQPQPLREVDLRQLDEPYRSEVRKLINRAGAAKLALRHAETSTDKRASIDQFNDVVHGIQEQVAEHEARKQTRIGGRVQQREAVVGDLVGKIGAKPTATSHTATAEAPTDAGLIRKWLGRGSLSMQTIATHLDPKRGDVYGVTIDNIRKAQEQHYGEQHRWTDHLTDALKEAGYDRGSAKLDRFLNDKKTIELPDAGKVTLTRDQMLGLHAASGDPETMALIRRGAVWNFRSNPLAQPFHVSERDIIAIQRMLTPGERKLSDSFKKYNQQNLTAPLMDASLRLRGWAPDPHEGYFPRARNRQQNVTEGLPEGWRGPFREAMENISALKDRAPDLKQPLLVPGFVETTDRYVQDAAKVIHLAEPVRTAAMVWEDPRVKAAIEQKFGPSMRNRVSQFLMDTMQVRQKPRTEWYDHLSQFATRNLSRAWLQLNPSPMLKNVLGGTANLMPVFDAQDFAHGVTRMFSPSVFRRMLNVSDIAWHRYNGGLYGQYSPITGSHVETIAEMNFTDALKQAGHAVATGKSLSAKVGGAAGKVGAAVDAMPFMEWADSVPFRAAYAASEHFVERTQPQLAGEAKQRAILDKFHDAVYATQNGTSSTEISGLASVARKNSLISPLFLFTSDSNKSYNLLAQMKDASASTRAKTVLATALRAVISAATGYGLKTGTVAIGRAITGAQQNPQELKRRNQGAVLDLIENLFSPAYGIASMIEAGRGLFAPQVGSSPITDPVHDFFNDAIESTSHLGSAVYHYATSVKDSPAEQQAMKALHSQLFNLFTAGTTFTGLPVAPVANLVKRAVDAGGFVPPDARLVARQKAAAAAKARHDSLPGPLQSLLAEKKRLDSLGELRTDAENDRWDDLSDVEGMYREWQQAERDKDKAGAADLKAEMLRQAGEITSAASKAKR